MSCQKSMDKLKRVKNKATTLHKSCNKCWLITSSLGQNHSLRRSHWVGWAFGDYGTFLTTAGLNHCVCWALWGNFPVTTFQHICQIKCMFKALSYTKRSINKLLRNYTKYSPEMILRLANCHDTQWAQLLD